MKKITQGILLFLVIASQCQADEFAFKLYNQLRATEGNLFFSPASIEAALAMTREGAQGATLDQFNDLLPEHTAFPTVGSEITLENANAIWIDQTFPILDLFSKAVQTRHHADLRDADFIGQPTAERTTINQWVEKKTRDKIKDLLPEGSVTSMTRLLLVNAIYFKGDWLHAFDPKLTRDEPFWTSAETSLSVPMMTSKETRVVYGENEEFQMVTLPYKGDEVSMLLLLPLEKEGLPPIEDSLSTDRIEACLEKMRRQKINLFLPRFKIESSFPSMKRTLTALGLIDAFDPATADFSGISKESLYISDVVHKAFVEVNEEGTEAAAATGIIMKATALRPPPQTFRADRPFLFLIRDNASGKILFMGRIKNPIQ